MRQPVLRMSHVTAGTIRLMPVIDALPSTDSAVPRRLLNQRATTPEAITGPVPASPSGTSTPYTAANSHTLRTMAVITSEITSSTVPTDVTTRTLKRSSNMPTIGLRKGPTAWRMPVEMNVETQKAATTHQP